MSGVTVTTATPAEAGMRLDKWFKAHYPALPFGRLQKLMRTGQVRLNGGRVKGKEKLEPGDEIRVPPLSGSKEKQKHPRRLSEDEMALVRGMVIHQDNDVIVLNKPRGLAVQGGTGTMRHIDRLLPGLKRPGSDDDPKLVHRLDKDTSGILMIARNSPAARFLTKAFRDKDCRKVYWAILSGVPKVLAGKIDAALIKGEKGAREKMLASDEGKKAVTYYKVLDRAGEKAAWAALVPLTGRTHQLRAHTALIGTPILGDGKYGGAAAHINGLSGVLHLHARAIEIPHPAGGALKVVAPLPPDMGETFQTLGFDQKTAADPFKELTV